MSDISAAFDPPEPSLGITLADQLAVASEAAASVDPASTDPTALKARVDLLTAAFNLLIARLSVYFRADLGDFGL